MEITNKQKELINAYAEEALIALNTLKAAQDHFKEIVESLTESTELKAAFISGYFKAKFDDKLSDIIEKAEAYDFLDSVTDAED